MTISAVAARGLQFSNRCTARHTTGTPQTSDFALLHDWLHYTSACRSRASTTAWALVLKTPRISLLIRKICASPVIIITVGKIVSDESKRAGLTTWFQTKRGAKLSDCIMSS